MPDDIKNNRKSKMKSVVLKPHYASVMLNYLPPHLSMTLLQGSMASRKAKEPKHEDICIRSFTLNLE